MAKNSIGFSACVLSGLDCAEKAMGSAPQSLFSDSAIWLWWAIAACWILGATLFLSKD